MSYFQMKMQFRTLLGSTLLIAVFIVTIYKSYKQLNFLSMNAETVNTAFIVIVTYYRSGSTLLAEIIQQSKQVFYIYEPFSKVSPDDIYESDNVCNAMNGQCRKPSHLFEQSSFALGQLQHYSNCNLDMLERTFMGQHKRSNDALQFERCRKQNDNFHCLQNSIRKCQNKIRFTKSIRLSLQVLKETINYTPSMKIIYLVRDPRGVINSRLSKQSQGNNSLTTIARALCNRYDADFRLIDSLTKTSRKRIKILSYEDVVSKPFIVTKDLYQFLDLSYNHNISSWLKTAMFSGKKSGFYEVFRANATKTAYQWKKLLSKDNITKIDNICGHLYTRLNIKKC